MDTLGIPSAPKGANTSSVAESIVLSASCQRLSMYATQAAWYSLTGVAASGSHYIAAGERLDFSVPLGTTISVVQDTVPGRINISELN